MLQILLNGLTIGDLDGTGHRLRLRYDPDALADPAFVPLSTGLPASQLRWRDARIRNWIQGLLPEREGVARRWRAEFGVSDTNPESLLAHIGEDVAGAAQFVRPDRMDIVLQGAASLTPLSEPDIRDLVLAARRDMLPYDADAGVGRFSLAGAQAKLALRRTEDGWALPAGAEPSTHIFKPAIPGLQGQEVSEVLSMRTAARAGLPTAPAFVADFGGQRVLGIERYDRVVVEDRWCRVHQENLCQAAGVYPLFKYESQSGPGAAACAALIRRTCGQGDVEAFARAMIFNYLVRGSDAHAQNYAILITPGNNRLAPLYDLNTTLTFGQSWATTMAMRIGGADRFDRVDRLAWDQFASDVGVPPEWVADELRRLSKRVPDALADARAELGSEVAGGVGEVFQDRLREWLGHVNATLDRSKR
ncbi:MAG: HipA domain-containing protein [Bifidobacteriaceae bacterium]|jgi:serine/threonine-protein kinase HipA|nr:HipA domain-containing protein [Bifidobacteriaceae bacterium]